MIHYLIRASGQNLALDIASTFTQAVVAPINVTGVADDTGNVDIHCTWNM